MRFGDPENECLEDFVKTNRKYLWAASPRARADGTLQGAEERTRFLCPALVVPQSEKMKGGRLWRRPVQRTRSEGLCLSIDFRKKVLQPFRRTTLTFLWFRPRPAFLFSFGARGFQ